jgi:hypothetical protein
MEEHILMAVLMVWDMCRLMGPVTILHMRPLPICLMALAEALAEDLARAEALAGEDGSRLNN